MGRLRKSRSEELTPSQIEAIVLAAIPLRKAFIAGFIDLVPFGEVYSLLHEQMEDLDAMLEKMTGRKIDNRSLDLGLLPRRPGTDREPNL